MWASAQRDGRPAKYRWHTLFNDAKFGWRPLLVCRTVTLPRRETHSNLQGCPKLLNESQPLVGKNKNKTRMWADAQRDGRPAECKWRPLFNAANFG